MDKAEQALKEWEATQVFPVSIIEAHGFINGYLAAQKEFELKQNG